MVIVRIALFLANQYFESIRFAHAQVRERGDAVHA